VRNRAWSLLAGVASSAALVLLLTSRAPVRAGDKAADEGAAVAARQQLVGEWKLNAELSEDPFAKMRQAREEGGWGGGGGHHGGHGGGYGHSGGGAQQGGQSGGYARSMMLTASQVTVTNIDPEVTVLDPDGQMRRFQADDKGHKDDAGNEVRAKWDADKLVVETKEERGTTKETWSVGGDPRRLTVLLEIKRSSGGSVSVKRVFDPVAKS